MRANPANVQPVLASFATAFRILACVLIASGYLGTALANDGGGIRETTSPRKHDSFASKASRDSDPRVTHSERTWVNCEAKDRCAVFARIADSSTISEL